MAKLNVSFKQHNSKLLGGFSDSTKMAFDPNTRCGAHVPRFHNSNEMMLEKY